MTHVHSSNNMSLFPNDNLHEFLVFMKDDTCGAINIEKSKYHIAIRSFLNKNENSLNYYKEFIEKNGGNFPKYEYLIQIINETLEISKYYIEQLPIFCQKLWLCMHH